MSTEKQDTIGLTGIAMLQTWLNLLLIVWLNLHYTLFVLTGKLASNSYLLINHWTANCSIKSTSIKLAVR